MGWDWSDLNPLSWGHRLVGESSGGEADRRAREEAWNTAKSEIDTIAGNQFATWDTARNDALGRIDQGFGQAANDFRDYSGRGKQEAQTRFAGGDQALDRARQDMLGGYGQAQGAIGAGLAGGLGSLGYGLSGGLGALGAGAAGAQGLLAGQIASDAAARQGYADRLMGTLGGASDPYWNRQWSQRQDSLEGALAKQGMIGSSAGSQALSDASAQLQMGREQEFFNRAQGLFNAGAAQQAAGLSQQAGMAGADLYRGYGAGAAGMYGDAGRASAGAYGDQARGLGGLGTSIADYNAGAGRWLGEFGQNTGRGLADIGSRQAEVGAGAIQDWARGRGTTSSDQMGARTAWATGQSAGQNRAQVWDQFMPNIGLNIPVGGGK